MYEVDPSYNPFAPREDLPEGLVDVVLEVTAHPERQLKRLELWASLPTNMRNLIDTMAFRVAPNDTVLRGEVCGSLIDMLNTLEQAELAAYLDRSVGVLEIE